MPVLTDSPECAALRADMEGDRLIVDSSILIRINQLKLMELWKVNRLSLRIDLVI